MCASGAGALGGLAGNPAGMQFSSLHVRERVLMSDIILVRMVADPTKAVEKQHGYRNALHGVYKMVQQEGPSSLARGLLPNTVCPALSLLLTLMTRSEQY
jgi:dicarboxylate transporter 10